MVCNIVREKTKQSHKNKVKLLYSLFLFFVSETAYSPTRDSPEIHRRPSRTTSNTDETPISVKHAVKMRLMTSLLTNLSTRYIPNSVTI